MNTEQFVSLIKRIVAEYANAHLDGMYYEITYNGDKQELYLDAYKKWENKCIKAEEVTT